MKLGRFCKHLLLSRWLVKTYFSKSDLSQIANRIAASESKHRAEIRVAIEANLHPLRVFSDAPVKQRAVDVFSQLRIWDTQENNGVLIYLLLADHVLEIVADRGIHQTLGEDYWQKINEDVIHLFKKKQYTDGICYAIEEITSEMVKLFPKQGEDPDELSNEVVIL